VIRTLSSFSLDAWAGYCALAEASIGLWLQQRRTAPSEPEARVAAAPAGPGTALVTYPDSSSELSTKWSLREGSTSAALRERRGLFSTQRSPLVDGRLEAKEAVGLMRRFSLVFPIGRARYLIYHGDAPLLI
jgi:hypothetical protein